MTILSMIQTFNLLEKIQVPATLDTLADVSGQPKGDVAQSLSLNLSNLVVTLTTGKTIFELANTQSAIDALYASGNIITPFSNMISSGYSIYGMTFYNRVFTPGWDDYGSGYTSPDIRLQEVQLIVSQINNDFAYSFEYDPVLTPNQELSFEVRGDNLDEPCIYFPGSSLETFEPDLDVIAALKTRLYALGYRYIEDAKASEATWIKLPGSLI